jgi:hypothetical protein
MSTPRQRDMVFRYPPLRFVIGRSESYIIAALRTFLISSVVPVGLVYVTYLEGTWSLPGRGRGLGEHYGYWAFFATTPLVLLLGWLMLITWRNLLEELPRYSVNGRLPTAVADLVHQHVDSLMLRTRWRYMLWLFTIIAAYLIVLNVRRTIDPVPVYGNDVFDSLQYRWSFLVGKFYLTLLYCLVYPSVIFISIHITISLIVLLKRMCELDVLRIDYFHSDNCGGVSKFGLVNLLVMSIYSAFAVILFCLHQTHNYAQPVNALPSFILSALLIAQSTGAVYYMHKFVRIKKRLALEVINKQLNDQFSDVRRTKNFPSDLLSVRSHLLSLRTYPYANTASLLVNGLRFAPAVAGVLKLVF